MLKKVIFRSGKPTYWYASRIGETFCVEDFYDDIQKKRVFKVVPESVGRGRVILKEDTDEFEGNSVLKRKLRPIYGN